MVSNAEIVRQYFEPYDGVDFKAPVTRAVESRSPGEDAAAVIERMGPAWAVLSPDIVWDTSPMAGEGPSTNFSGYSGFVNFWSEWLSVWDEYVYTVLDYIDRGPVVVAELQVRATGREGVPAEWTAGQACEVHDGQIVRMRVFPSAAQALDSLDAEGLDVAEVAVDEGRVHAERAGERNS